MESTSCALETGPLFRVWLCGPLCLERRQAATYEPLPLSAWGGSAYPRQLLKALLCCPRRQAHRERLLAWLWPDAAPDQAASALHTATTKLRKVLQPPGASSLLESLSEGHGYRLPGQALLWVDAEEALQLLQQAEACQRTGDPLAVERLLEEAVRYWQRGTFLEGEEGDWVLARRATHERACYRARWWLSEIYEQQGRWPEAEAVLTELWEEDPTDGEVVARLVTVLLRQGRRQEARRCYRDWRHLLARTGDSLDEQSAQAIERVLHAAGLTESQPSPSPRPASPLPGFLSGPNQGILDMKTLHWSTATDRQRRQLLQTTLEGLGLLALPGIGSTSLFEEHVHSLSEELFQVLDSMLQKVWSLFYYHMASTNLQPIVQGLLQAGQLLLHQAHSDLLRQRASAFLSGVCLLTGRIALDQTGASLAVHAYQEALSYARDAVSSPLESLVIARIGGDLHEQHPQMALSLLSEARHLYSSKSAQLDQKLQAWIALHEAEAYARLQQKQRCLTALDQAENLDLHEASDPFWTAVNPALLWGFKGACLLTLGEPALAAEALERAKQLAAPSRRQQAIFSADLALARAYQGEIDMACAAGEEALLLLLEVRSSCVLTRLQRLLPVLSHWSGEACVQRWWSTWREGAALLGHVG
uniref:Bacterial transcriptional activator domain-containing protein n=1 Tax=Thermogemmatispora argillosa TaxID=2045280 RepID=A0A455SZB5_9CHLR|nr:hypothetical protein KTA_04410 [Thermogemmatispora argillosa]